MPCLLFACTFVSGTLTPAYGHSVIASSDSFGYTLGPSSPTFLSATLTLQGPTALSQNALLPLMAFTCLSRLCCSFSSSGTYYLNNGKSRVKGKGDNGKRSSRKKRQAKKEKEGVPFVDSQLYHTTLELMGNGSPFSESDPFASICTQFSQMESADVQ